MGLEFSQVYNSQAFGRQSIRLLNGGQSTDDAPREGRFRWRPLICRHTSHSLCLPGTKVCSTIFSWQDSVRITALEEFVMTDQTRLRLWLLSGPTSTSITGKITTKTTRTVETETEVSAQTTDKNVNPILWPLSTMASENSMKSPQVQSYIQFRTVTKNCGTCRRSC